MSSHDFLTSKTPLSATWYANEFLAWADNPAQSGYVPVHPETLRKVAKILRDLDRPAVEPVADQYKCPFCDRLRDETGSIWHVPNCEGLENAGINKLQHHMLLSRRAEPPKGSDEFPADCERFRFLCADIHDRDLRNRRNLLLERMASMSASSVRADVDLLMSESDGPGEEDGAWSPGFDERSNKAKGQPVTKTATPAIEFEVGEKVTGASGTVGTVTSNDFVNLLGERLYHVAYPTLGVAVSVPGKDLRRAHETSAGESK